MISPVAKLREFGKQRGGVFNEWKSLEAQSDAARVDEEPLRLENVLADEYRELHPHKNPAAQIDAIVEQIHDEKHAALCLSGGGIRSATFGLGVLQGLAKRDYLSRFHYLSTVSGGGYVGGWLSSWLSRERSREPSAPSKQGIEAVTLCLKTGRDLLEPDRLSKTDNEPAPIRHLRSYSRYLSPRVGVFSVDTWTLGAAYVRNLLLTWLVLLPGIAAVVGIPMISAAVMRKVAAGEGHPLWLLPALIAAGFLGIVASVRFVHRHRPDPRFRDDASPPIEETRPGQQAFLVQCLLPFVVSGVTLTVAWVWVTSLGVDVIEPVRRLVYGIVRILPDAIENRLPAWATAARLTDVPLDGIPWVFIVPFILMGGLAHTLGWLFCGRVFDRDKWRGRIVEGFLVFAAGSLCAFLVARVGWLVSPWPNVWVGNTDERYTTLALPVYCALLVLAIDLHLGFISGRSQRADDAEREWSARFNAWVLAVAVGWLVFSTLTILVPHYLADRSPNWASWSSLSALVSGALAAWLGRSAKTGTTAGSVTSTLMSVIKSLPHKLGLTAAMAVFSAALVVALTLMVSGATKLIACKLRSEPFCGGEGVPDISVVAVPDAAPWGWLLAGVVALALVSLFSGLAIDMNKFSLHGLYRLRLIRAYLGASRVQHERKPDPFMGFDTGDNINMSALRSRPGPGDEPRLFHVVNVALNMVRGAQLAWQDRKAESFTISPLHAGNHRLMYRRTGPSDLQHTCDQAIKSAPSNVLSDSDKARLRPRYYGGADGPSLGTAMAISGAAASPNMGYHSSALVTFVMTLFNARLGWWLANPGMAGQKVFHRTAPQFSLKTLWEELLGATTDRNKYVYLSDGGHFENLGLYEMVLRRNRFILVSDASADPECALGDLGTAIRHIRADFRIPITFSPTYFSIRKRGEGVANDGSYWAVARIGYSAVDAPPDMPADLAAQKYDGVLLYLKPCFYGREPRDVYNYAQESLKFPHEPTADQFFSETQFESYRALGEYVVDSVCEALTIDDMFRGVYPVAGPSAPVKQEPFARKAQVAGVGQ